MRSTLFNSKRLETEDGKCDDMCAPSMIATLVDAKRKLDVVVCVFCVLEHTQDSMVGDRSVPSVWGSFEGELPDDD
jgi:hypothetical protein